MPEPGKDLYSGEPAFFNLERGENGSFVASLPAGNYHAEAFARPGDGHAYKPEIAGGIANPTTFTIEGSDTSITGINFSLEEEFRMSHEFAPIEGEVTEVAGRDDVDHVFFDLFPVKDGVRQTNYPIFHSD